MKVSAPKMSCLCHTQMNGGDQVAFNAFLCLLQIPKRLMLALSLLKKEYELSKLQQRIGKEVMSQEVESSTNSVN